MSAPKVFVYMTYMSIEETMKSGVFFNLKGLNYSAIQSYIICHTFPPNKPKLFLIMQAVLLGVKSQKLSSFCLQFFQT